MRSPACTPSWSAWAASGRSSTRACRRTASERGWSSSPSRWARSRRATSSRGVARAGAVRIESLADDFTRNTRRSPVAETTTNKATETARAAAASVPQRLAELRDLAAEDPWRAQEETWAWIEDLGKNRESDKLEELFALGTPPRNLDGPTDGILVATFTNPLVDLPIRLLT